MAEKKTSKKKPATRKPSPKKARRSESKKEILDALSGAVVAAELEIVDDLVGSDQLYDDATGEDLGGLGVEDRILTHEIGRGGESVIQTALVDPASILPSNLLVVPVNNAVIYPTLVAPLMITEPKFIETVEEVLKRQKVIGLLLIREDEVNAGTKIDDLHSVGVAVRVVKRIRMPDGSVNLLVNSLKRFKVIQSLSERPYMVVQADYHEDKTKEDIELDALSRAVMGRIKNLSSVNPFFTDEMRLAILNAPTAGAVADLVAFALGLPREEAQVFLEMFSVKERLQRLLEYLKREQDVSELQKKIQDDVNHRINSMQRDFFLREQLKAIKKELGLEEDSKEQVGRKFAEKIESLKMPEEAKKIAEEELRKLETLNEQSPEYNVARTYLEMILSLPWNVETNDILDLDYAEKVLEEDHYGLERVKERILEFLAVKKLTQDQKAPLKGSILCLVGPPGVGKTSIGKSIARSLGRNFYRFSLGGMRDEAEIKGHRRTYVGAMPGKVIQAYKRAGSKNPVIMLDEIDKLGRSFQGDPASALLEILDPEQNGKFVDHYLDAPFDLSQTIFVATANDLSTIPEPLLDRMELIEIPGYTLEEKEEIALRYLWPRVLKSHGMKSYQVRIPKKALKQIMLEYAREPGVRTLQRALERIARKAAAKSLRRRAPKSVVVDATQLKDWLGPKRFENDFAERITRPGVMVGMAWTAMGGDILFIEATRTPGSGQIKLTGKMGEVMTESANIAWTYVRRILAEEKLITEKDLKGYDYHLHIPAGAIPKDGPSAGITMAATLYSLITGRPAKSKLSMTGELSLIGKVLPVGGIKEKLLAAKRSGVTTAVLPDHNRKDLEEIPTRHIKGLDIHFVKHFDEVLPLVLSSRSIKQPSLDLEKDFDPQPQRLRVPFQPVAGGAPGARHHHAKGPLA